MEGRGPLGPLLFGGECGVVLLLLLLLPLLLDVVELDDDDDDVEELCVLVVVVCVVVVASDGHDSETLETPEGRPRLETGSPGASWKYMC